MPLGVEAPKSIPKLIDFGGTGDQWRATRSKYFDSTCQRRRGPASLKVPDYFHPVSPRRAERRGCVIDREPRRPETTARWRCGQRHRALTSGEGGIRTPETVTRLRDFQSRSFSLSDTSPCLIAGGGEGPAVGGKCTRADRIGTPRGQDAKKSVPPDGCACLLARGGSRAGARGPRRVMAGDWPARHRAGPDMPGRPCGRRGGPRWRRAGGRRGSGR